MNQLILHKFKPHKYHVSANKEARTVDGWLFHSLKEARYYCELKLRVRAGEVLFFLRQVPFHLSGNEKYLLDFLEFWANGEIHFIDVKGIKTREYIRKKKKVLKEYAVEIEEK